MGAEEHNDLGALREVSDITADQWQQPSSRCYPPMELWLQINAKPYGFEEQLPI